MKLKHVSPFKPKNIKDYSPQDLKIYTLKAGFKKKYEDLLVIVFDKVVSVANSILTILSNSWDELQLFLSSAAI